MVKLIYISEFLFCFLSLLYVSIFAFFIIMFFHFLMLANEMYGFVSRKSINIIPHTTFDAVAVRICEYLATIFL